MTNKISVILSVLMIVALIAIGFGCAPAPPPGAQKTYVLKGQFLLPKGHPVDVPIEYFMDKVEAATKGQVKFERVNYNANLVPMAQMMDAVSKRTIDFASTTPHQYPGAVPFWQVAQVTLCTFPGEKWRKTYMDSFVWPTFQELAEQKFNAKMIMGSTSYPTVIITKGKRVAKMEDLKGLRLRATGTSGEALKLAGGEPKTVVPQEYYTAMQTGVIDGVLLPTYSLKDYSLQELATCVTMVALGGSGFGALSLYINKDAWNEIPADIQKTILAQLPDTYRFHDKNYDDTVKSEVEKLKQYKNIEVIQLPKDELSRWYQTIGIPTWESVAKKLGEPLGPKWLDVIKKASGV